MNRTKFSPPRSHFGITIFEQDRKRRNGGSLCIKHGTLSKYPYISHYITLHQRYKPTVVLLVMEL